jgi:hypothetical protein
MKCPSCGHSNRGANRFCNECGTKLEGLVPTEAPAPEATPPVPGPAIHDESEVPPDPSSLPPISWLSPDAPDPEIDPSARSSEPPHRRPRINLPGAPLAPTVEAPSLPDDFGESLGLSSATEPAPPPEAMPESLPAPAAPTEPEPPLTVQEEPFPPPPVPEGPPPAPTVSAGTPPPAPGPKKTPPPPPRPRPRCRRNPPPPCLRRPPRPPEFLRNPHRQSRASLRLPLPVPWRCRSKENTGNSPSSAKSATP